jgi:hypothetical protein
MGEIVITLERRGPNALKPVGGNPQRVPADSIVKFVLADPQITGTTIEFKSDPFPFAEKVVTYRTGHQVEVAFNSVESSKNIYKFKCHARGPNGEALDSEEGGGEIEIVPGG